MKEPYGLLLSLYLYYSYFMRSLTRKLYQRFFFFIRTTLTRPQYIILVSVITGLVSGIIAVLLKTIVHYLQKLGAATSWYYLFLPVLGLLVTVAVVYFFFQNHIEKGIALVLRSIAKRSSYIPTSNTYKHVITSSLTVGMGGSAGLEAPIVATGSSYGSLFGRVNELNYQERTLMIACGAAAGIAAVFNAPIAGVIFAVEVLLTETAVSYFIPLMIASVAGTLCSKIILQESILFNFVLKQDFNYYNVPFYLLLGVLAGFVSLYYARVFKFIEHRLQAIRISVFGKALLGGLLLAGLVFLFPPLFGEGYESVSYLANSNAAALPLQSIFDTGSSGFWFLLMMAGIVLLKPVAAGITLGAGGNGGNFAPSLFTGSFLGFFFSRLVNTTGISKLPESNFTLVGMAGMLSGIMYCPLTSIFLIAEITNGYGLFVPLMIVSSISFFIVKHFEPYSMDLKKLAMEGEVFTHKKEQNILTSLSLETLLVDQYPTIPAHTNMEFVVDVIRKTDRNIFAVVDEDNKFVGQIELNDIKKMIFDPAGNHKHAVKSVMKKPRAQVLLGESMKSVMEKFDSTQVWYLPVVDADKKFVSFVSKSRIFEKYREILSSQKDLYESEPSHKNEPPL